MAIFVVENHMGGLYFEEVTYDDEQIGEIEEICEQCGDSDWVLDTIETYEQALKFIKKLKRKHEYTDEHIDELEKEIAEYKNNWFEE